VTKTPNLLPCKTISLEPNIIPSLLLVAYRILQLGLRDFISFNFAVLFAINKKIFALEYF
jgi:hypothetical protein